MLTLRIKIEVYFGLQVHNPSVYVKTQYIKDFNNQLTTLKTRLHC